MPKFVVTVGRDARVYYTAEVEAESVEAAKALLHADGYDAPEGTVWERAGIETFDNVETCDISDETGTTLSSYEDGEGWG